MPILAPVKTALPTLTAAMARDEGQRYVLTVRREVEAEDRVQIDLSGTGKIRLERQHETVAIELVG